MEENSLCFIQFKYSCKINEDEEIRIVGNKEELGNWDYNKSKNYLFYKLILGFYLNL